MSIDKLKTKFFNGSFVNDVKHYFNKINEIIDYLNGNGTSGGGSYKVYSAVISQTDTNAPVATVLENTLGNIIFSYEGVGSYKGTLTGAFTTNKTLFLSSNRDIASYMSIGISDENSFIFESVLLSDPTTPSNDVISSNGIEIRVYN